MVQREQPPHDHSNIAEKSQNRARRFWLAGRTGSLLLFVLLVIFLWSLFPGRCSGPIEESPVPVANQRYAVSVENIDTTYNDGVVNLTFEVVLTPAAGSSVTVDYQIEHSPDNTPNDIEPPLASRVSFTQGESHKTIHHTFNSLPEAEFNLALIGSSSNASIGVVKNYRLIPIDIAKTGEPSQPPSAENSFAVTVAVSPEQLGTVSGGGSYAKGDVITVSAIPASGSEFVNWSEDGTVISGSEHYQFKVARDRILIAHFRRLPPSASITDKKVRESNSGISKLIFTVGLSAKADSDITVNYVTSDGSATGGVSCGPGVDYIATRGTLTIARGSRQASFNVPICGDKEPEDDETFTVTLSEISANAVLATMTAAGTITNDDVPPVIAGETAAVAPPASPVVAPPQFTAEERFAGYDYLKLDAAGKPLADQSATYAATPWSCVWDRKTGLVWEIKSADGGLHHMDWTYSWYNSNSVTNGGHMGAAGKGLCENSVPAGCDTEKFVSAVNAAGYCGANDWRLPSQEELQSIADLARTNPSLNSTVFPNSHASWYWSSTPVASDQNHAWVIGFFYGYDVWGRKSNDFYVRLVRTGK